MQKLMGLVQYAPEEEQNELATLLAKAASTKNVQRKVTDGNKLAERGSITFTKKELSQMSDDTERKLFIYNNNIVSFKPLIGVCMKQRLSNPVICFLTLN